MTDWDGRVYKEDRFRDDIHYDQEFGKPLRNDANNSSMERSRTTHFKNTVEHEDGTESYLQRSPNKRSKTFVESERSGSSNSRRTKSPIRSKEKEKPKQRKPLGDGKDLGRAVKRDLARAAELKLGTKLDNPKSLFDFWKNHVKERPKRKENISTMSMSMASHKPPRPGTADNRSSAGQSSSAPKNKKVLELQKIYDLYKNATANDIYTTLQNIDKEDKMRKERMDEEKKIMMEKANKQQKEQEIRDTLHSYFKKYMDKKVFDKVNELAVKRNEIDEIRANRQKKRSRSRPKDRKKGPTRSPIKLEHSLDIEESKIEESKMGDQIEESIKSDIKKSARKSPSRKKDKKEKKKIDETKYTDDEIKNFDYASERGLTEDAHKILFRLYAELVFHSRSNNVKFTNDGDKLLIVWRDPKNEKIRSQYCKELHKVYKHYSKDEKDVNFLKRARDDIEESIVQYFNSDREFMDRVIINYEKEVAPRLRSNDRIVDFYHSFNKKEAEKKKRGIHRKDGIEIIKKFVDEENKKLSFKKLVEERKKQKKEEAKKKVTEKVFKEFKNPEVKAHTIDELAQSKDKWKKGRKLKQLAQKFPHDVVLQRMIKEEFKENRVFRYPEEYEIYDNEEETKRKMPTYHMKTSAMLEEEEVDNQEKMQMKMEKFIHDDNRDKQIEKLKAEDRKHKMKKFNEDMKKEIQDYKEKAKNRLNGGRDKGQRETLAEMYKRLNTHHPEICEELYKTKPYGILPGSRAEQLWYPPEFKTDFYERYRKACKKGRATSTRPAYFVPGGISRDSKNKKITIGMESKNKKEVPTQGTTTRVWKREDYIEARKEIMMSKDDAENCTFEPNAGSQNPHLKKILNTYPELEREEYDKEKTLKDFVGKLGDKFVHSNPEIFKGGILRAAKNHFNQGNLRDAISKLSEGFKFISLKRQYDEKFAKKYQQIKKREVEIKKRAKMSAEEKQKDDLKKRKKQTRREKKTMKIHDGEPKKISPKKRKSKRSTSRRKPREESKTSRSKERSVSKNARRDRDEKKDRDSSREKDSKKESRRDSRKRRDRDSDRDSSSERSVERSQERKRKVIIKPIKKTNSKFSVHQELPYEEKFPHQKDLKEEKFEEPKMKPILEEAYHLLIQIEGAMKHEKKEKKTLKNLVRAKNSQLKKENQKKEQEFLLWKLAKEKKKLDEAKARQEENEKYETKLRKIQDKKDREEKERKRLMAEKLKEEKKTMFKTAPKKKMNKDLKY